MITQQIIIVKIVPIATITRNDHKTDRDHPNRMSISNPKQNPSNIWNTDIFRRISNSFFLSVSNSKYLQKNLSFLYYLVVYISLVLVLLLESAMSSNR